MNRFLLLWGLLVSLFSLSGMQHLHAAGEYAGKVVMVSVGESDLSNTQAFKFMERVMKRAQDEGAEAVVVELNTPGGLAWETSELMMKVLQPMKIPTYAYVNPKAMSAGALIAAACETIYMSPVSSIGAAGLVSGTGQEIDPMMRKKLESAFGAFMRSVVAERGHNVDLIKAMMVPSEKDLSFGSVKLPKGELLTLTGKEAVEVVDGKPLLAKGIAQSVNDLLEKENIKVPVIKATPTGFESIAWWLAWASPVLILIGIGGIYFEFKTPGFGIGSVIALAAFGLFFFGNNVAGNLAGYETAALFVLGIVLLCVEFFVLPGTVVFAALGGLCVLFALFGGMIDAVDVDKLFSPGGFSLDALMALGIMPLFKLSLGMAGAVALILFMMRYLPQFSLMRGLMNSNVSGEFRTVEDSPDSAATASSSVKPGAQGIALTELRPSGTAQFNGQYYEVMARDGFHPKGAPLVVVEVQATRLIVEAVPNS